ncbi:metallophosphoesterase family protein [Olsenella massiliensis]|uniref:metallophosphoesterase family protein n=1 Tax=Olsenella massiliensis TaxID=1622075 RepID=UPI00071DA66B|nr:metallophosphoesterase family protein [Olsenella massiliensis]
MATYAFSDVHGHRAPLERLLERVAPSDDDTIFMLGDMVDRGPDPVGVMRLCRSLKGAQVLMGNHEDLMMSYVTSGGSAVAQLNWEINGSHTTLAGLEALGEPDRLDLLDWVFNLPLCGVCELEGRLFVLVHAGIRPLAPATVVPASLTPETLARLLDDQDAEDLMWIREEFWSRPTGLVDEQGRGAVVIAGHTPAVYLTRMADHLEREPVDADGLCRQVRAGGQPQTGGVWDRWDIDAGAAGGAGFGQVSLLRLDDGAEFYERIAEGE